MKNKRSKATDIPMSVKKKVWERDNHRCVVCGNTHDIVTMSSYLGGYVCKNCLRNEKVISTKSIKLIRMLYLVDISKLNKLDISKDVLKELEEFTEDYYDRYSGIYLKSKILLDTIK